MSRFLLMFFGVFVSQSVTFGQMVVLDDPRATALADASIKALVRVDAALDKLAKDVVDLKAAGVETAFVVPDDLAKALKICRLDYTEVAGKYTNGTVIHPANVFGTFNKMMRGQVLSEGRSLAAYAATLSGDSKELALKASKDATELVAAMDAFAKTGADADAAAKENKWGPYSDEAAQKRKASSEGLPMRN